MDGCVKHDLAAIAEICFNDKHCDAFTRCDDCSGLAGYDLVTVGCKSDDPLLFLASARDLKFNTVGIPDLMFIILIPHGEVCVDVVLQVYIFVIPEQPYLPTCIAVKSAVSFLINNWPFAAQCKRSSHFWSFIAANAEAPEASSRQSIPTNNIAFFIVDPPKWICYCYAYLILC